MSKVNPYFAKHYGAASVERFLLARLEQQMTADVRGHMGAHWNLPFTGTIVEVALDCSDEQSEAAASLAGAEAQALTFKDMETEE